MSLLTPSPGEIYDRLGIIAMKVATIKPTPEHLLEEREGLFSRIWDYTSRRGERLLPEDLQREALACAVVVDELFAVNALIWHKEDEIRKLGGGLNADGSPGATGLEHRIAHLAYTVRRLADRRHYLIAEIDRLYGEPRAGKEKSWMKPPEEYHQRRPE